MSNYNSLKTTIDANIKQNGRQEITGQILNSVLNQMVNTLGAGYQFAGVATTATTPGSPDAKVFYIANGKGTYTNFGGIDVTEDDVVVLYWDSSWHKVSTGIASQAKLTDLDGDIKELIGGDIDLDLSYESNVLPNPDGTFFTDSSSLKRWYSSGYSNIPKGATFVKFSGIQYNTSTITPIAFYDKDKAFISCYPFQGGGTPFRYIEGEMSVPKEAVYFMQSLYQSGQGDEGHPERVGENYTQFTITPKYDFDEINKVLPKIGKDISKYGLEVFTSNIIYRANGTTNVYGGTWVSTDFVPCMSGQKVSYKGYRFYNSSTNDIAVVSFFNSLKQFIGCVAASSFGGVGSGEVSGEVLAPNNTAFVRVVSLSTIADSMLSLSATGLMLVRDDVSILNVNNAKGIKVCCVGDSLTQGVDVASHVIAESYPYFLGKYLGCSIVNYGKKGETSKSWWNKFSASNPFDSSMDVVLIMFGTNGGLTTNTLSTDVEPFDDWQDYADTSVGDYCKLIESIMDQTGNKTQIILMTPPYSSYTPQQTQIVINTEPVVRAIAKRYNLPVIDILNECGMGKFNAAMFRPHDGCHFNAKGYHKLGTFIGSQLKSLFSTFDFTDVYDDETPIS